MESGKSYILQLIAYQDSSGGGHRNCDSGQTVDYYVQLVCQVCADVLISDTWGDIL